MRNCTGHPVLRLDSKTVYPTRLIVIVLAGFAYLDTRGYFEDSPNPLFIAPHTPGKNRRCAVFPNANFSPTEIIYRTRVFITQRYRSIVRARNIWANSVVDVFIPKRRFVIPPIVKQRIPKFP